MLHEETMYTRLWQLQCADLSDMFFIQNLHLIGLLARVEVFECK